MTTLKKHRGLRWTPVAGLAIGLLALSSVAGAVPAAGQAQVRVQVQDAPPPPAPAEWGYTYVQSNFSAGEPSQVPQEIRIMQRIVTTALGEVTPPELPEALREEPDVARAIGLSSGNVGGTTVWTYTGGGNRPFGIGGRDVNGFYMQGYGYLFNVSWQVSSRGRAFGEYSERVAELNALAIEARRAGAAGQSSEARAAGEAERTLDQERERVEERQAAWETWSAEYRMLLGEALREVVAGYGGTLRRASPEESITFIADFGGGETEIVTVSARRSDLGGAGREQNLGAVQLARGGVEMSDTQRTELKIMAEIIDSSMQVERTGDVWPVYAEQLRFGDGRSAFQYVPGYGVLFRRSARLNLATRVVQRVNPDRVEPGVIVAPLRQRIEETTEEQQAVYAEHLAELKQQTADVLATYGPTLTELGDDEWVGIYYNVGSAAGLLEGGISNYLVQARMRDIRQAGMQGADGSGWLFEQLVTNERQN